jgi:hypothetical protein
LMAECGNPDSPAAQYGVWVAHTGPIRLIEDTP